MNFFIINRRQILTFFSLLLTFVFFGSFYYISAHSNNSLFCYEETTFCITPLSNLKDNTSSDIQEKIDSIYSSNEKIAYLTFDDGPTKVATPRVLDILKEENVKATFFVIGYRVEEFPDTVKRAYEEGHFIANHTYSHKNAKLYQSKESFFKEINQANSAIAKAIGTTSYSSHLFRFPNGSKGTSYSGAKKRCLEYLKEINYAYVDWNALNNDSIHKYTSSELLNNLKNSCKNKDSIVVLMHDTADVSRSYLALQDSIKYLKEQGYTFKTFEDLLL